MKVDRSIFAAWRPSHAHFSKVFRALPQVMVELPSEIKKLVACRGWDVFTSLVLFAEAGRLSVRALSERLSTLYVDGFSTGQDSCKEL